MNLEDVNDNETELTDLSSHKQEKQSMSFQEKHKTVKRSVIEFDDLDDNKEDLCEI